MTDLSPDERKLIPLITITDLRGRAFRRNQATFLWPFPDCHECGQTVDEVRIQEKYFPATGISVTCKPCGHKTDLPREALRRISKAAAQAADQLENGSFLDMPDWLRGGVCCVCSGAGGPVVYRNFRDQPFCGHCCECDCGTVPCSKPDPVPEADRRQKYAKAIHRYDYENGLSGNDIPSKHHLGEADAVLAVRDAELEQLRDRVDQEAAAIERVRQLHHDWDADPGHCAHCQNGMGTPLRFPCPTIQAIDPKEQP
jgi:hypothetical protein